MKHIMLLISLCAFERVLVCAANAGSINFLKKVSFATITSNASTTFTTKGAIGGQDKKQIQIKPGKNSFDYQYNRSQNALTFFNWIDQATIKQPVQKIQLEGQWKKADGSVGGPWTIAVTVLQKDTRLVLVVDSLALNSILSTQMINITPMISSAAATQGGTLKSTSTEKSPSEQFIGYAGILPLAKSAPYVLQAYLENDFNYLAQVRLHCSIYPLQLSANASDRGVVQVDAIDLIFVDYKKGSSARTHTVTVKVDDLLQKVDGIVSPVIKPAGESQYVSGLL